MLIPIAYGSHRVRQSYEIYVNKILNDVFMMFVDLKTDFDIETIHEGRMLEYQY